MLNGTADGESRWNKVWQFTKTYARHVGSVYLSFLTPAALVIAYNAAMVTQDTERFGLAWMHYAGVQDEEEREQKFPAYEPGSAPQRKRLAAAGTREYVSSTA